MPWSPDDAARLPPMLSHEEVVRNCQREDLRDFRQYLVDTGMVKCLVKMFQHTVKHEMRIDNPTLVMEFLKTYIDEASQQHQEAERLLHENANLFERQTALQAKKDELQKEVARATREITAKRLWSGLASDEFWDSQSDTTSQELLESGLSVDRLYRRLCGGGVDKATGLVLVDLLRPPSIEDAGAGAVLLPNKIADLVAEMDDDLFGWVCDVLLPGLEEVAGVPPFEAALLGAIRGSEHYPEAMERVTQDAELGEDLLAFFEVAAACAAKDRNLAAA